MHTVRSRSAFWPLRPSIRCCCGPNCSYLPLSGPSQTGLSHKQRARTASLQDDSHQCPPENPPSNLTSRSGCICGLQASQHKDADNLISWDEPQTYNGDAVKSQMSGRPQASLANSIWARSMLGPAQLPEQQDVIEAEAGALFCIAALSPPPPRPKPIWCGLSERCMSGW